MLYAAWLLAATALAFVGLVAALESKGEAERYLNLWTQAQYAGVVVAVALVAYVIHRVIAKSPPATARRRAALDAFWAAIVAAPCLLFVVVVVSTIQQCTFGTGC